MFVIFPCWILNRYHRINGCFPAFLSKVLLPRFTPILFPLENENRFTLTFKLFKAKKIITTFSKIRTYR
ncbi:hypothetical protein LEP1GSC137_1050 [Leptospira borgpetersenii str. Noumea 25]|uniref:Uncharacterized protein n=1 Tax=Leptospira borgpetersenii serovar Ballum TaxID=280505 RepID=A0A0E3B632_LEPBO|nr:hypothetical protein LBBP_03854 [Leptospira borgpetersenii serovar Ballum]EKR00810.1 hypothetical protein LEP1GSC121_0107 [Leptospira borgpetersenii serovar Castellonis str. 200801910]EMO07710.1 hypothetical protein LEP1GSC137_1050 [Leptospira borgpetersenii str. Noumea 25]KGE26318.1 hypothetical protein IQ66_01125 [Leptospira borgpetersenii serovar Ballum]